MRTTTMLRQLLDRGSGPLVLPGAPNALTARVVEEAGFEAVYVSGAGVANTQLALPDLGLLTLPELAGQVAAMSDATTLPLVVDADTGFGNAMNVGRTVRMLERAGAAAIQIEDQASPKKCGHFSGKEIVSTGEMTGKIRAAVDARVDDDLVVVARTDALAVKGIGAACERAAAFAEAGADVLFVEAPTTREEMARIVREVPGRHVANMVEGGLTPVLSREELDDLGYSVALYANTAMRGAVLGMRTVLEHLARHGDTRDAAGLMISWEERQSLVRKPHFDVLDKLYAPDDGTEEAAS
ncbi:oxaloacetate decarboxylase [Streptomyces sp. DSM 42041]|uniref:Oxaloacetate decarboxylase n=1 Tax=Streptomyces hazeniae TaxID=3075538 RepID=A0ABU2NLL2_9ACTN|nr:oxaloacetate decarboxylase [Streptomyces sp. DSM 42041]MDT0377855.1 oxaloacetate decarboxylase [Streptomyces sp. DSM 42041]